MDKTFQSTCLFVFLMTKRYIGTSGWSYEWNLGNSLDWYLQNSGLNAVELNMSFYRFPFPTMVRSWAKKGSELRWVVKVHRLITHYKKLKKDSYESFQRFKQLFVPLEPSIDYYLLQLPPRYTNLSTIEAFIQNNGSEKIAVEFRDPAMFTKEIADWAKKMNILLVSIDAPQMPSHIMSSSTVYERIHGRTEWYAYHYTLDELKEIKERISAVQPRNLYMFFNNYSMLQNAQQMFTLFHEK